MFKVRLDVSLGRCSEYKEVEGSLEWQAIFCFFIHVLFHDVYSMGKFLELNVNDTPIFTYSLNMTKEQEHRS